jgi:hypothetical protein
VFSGRFTKQPTVVSAVIKSKAVLVTGIGGLLRIPYSVDNRITDGGKVVSLTRRPRSTAQKHIFHLLLLISVRGWVNPTEGLGKLKTTRSPSPRSAFAYCATACRPVTMVIQEQKINTLVQE